MNKTAISTKINTALRGGTTCACWMVLCASLAQGAAPPQVSAKAKPDVVLVTIDTLRADHLGCYGYKRGETPNLDALAASAARFAHAYTPVPITLPAHTAIMTASYPMATGIHDFSGNKLPADAVTLAKVLYNDGYRTGAFVSAAVLDSRFGLNAGFDTYYAHFDFNRLDEANLDLVERPGDQTTDLALGWLRDDVKVAGADRKPFFLWLHLYDPHFPYTPPEPYATKFREQPYDGEIAFADAQVGRLLVFLRGRRLFDNTVIVVCGDHGEGLGEHGEKTHGFFVYNSTLQVPLIVKVPGIAPSVVETNASLIDVMPTVLQALKIAIPPSVQGRSQLAEMQGRPVPSPESVRDLYAETYLPLLHFRWSELRAVLSQNLKYIDAPRPEAYDTRVDPGETKNLASKRPVVAHELRAKLLSLESRYTPASNSRQTKELTDPILLERLRALGYVAIGSGGYIDPQGKPPPDPKDRIEVYELFSAAMSDGQHGRYQESLDKLREAEKTEPASLPIRYLQALDYYRLKDYRAAVAKFQAAIAVDPKFALATYYLGLTQVELGDLDAAAASLQHSLELDPTNFSAAFDLGALDLKRDRIDEAMAQFQRAVEIKPDYAKAYEALGELYLYEKHFDQAAAALEQAVKLQPDFAKAHYHLGHAYEALGRNADARREFSLAGPGP
ncbi:MAG TPA: sulfatase-like hydrolase/transferase [Terriglobia bacterium]